jgi:hypothetical protein
MERQVGDDAALDPRGDTAKRPLDDVRTGGRATTGVLRRAAR